MTEANTTGSWFGQSAVNPTVPATLQVTADNHLAIPTALPPTTVPVPLTDLVTITRAQYSRGSGLLTIDAQGVICDGPACPDLTAPKAVIRIVGAAEAGAALMPPGRSG